MLVETTYGSVARTLQQEADTHRVLRSPTVSQEQARQVADDHEQVYVGSGDHRLVVQGRWPEEIVAFPYREITPTELQQTFYLHRIYHLLFPHNFPRVRNYFLIRDRDGKLLSGMTAQKVIGEPMTELPAYYTGAEETIPRYPFSTAYLWLRELGILTWIDSKAANFIRGEDGGEYYVDEIETPRRELAVERVMAWMNIHGSYKDTEKERVRKNLYLLNNLQRNNEISSSSV